jgi:hypothetical protein
VQPPEVRETLLASHDAAIRLLSELTPEAVA